MLKKLEDLGDINFHILFNPIYKIIISIWIQYKNEMKFYNHFFF